MRRLRFVLLSLPVLLVACATHDPGWQGRHAEPFDRAKATCEGEVAGLSAAGREAAFVSCMARHGWTR